MSVQPQVINYTFTPAVEEILTQSKSGAKIILIITALAIGQIFRDKSLSPLLTLAVFPLAMAFYDRLQIIRNVNAIRANPLQAGIFNSHQQVDGKLLLQAIRKNTIITGGPLLRAATRWIPGNEI
jgi:hypothetical protein